MGFEAFLERADAGEVGGSWLKTMLEVVEFKVSTPFVIPAFVGLPTTSTSPLSLVGDGRFRSEGEEGHEQSAISGDHRLLLELETSHPAGTKKPAAVFSIKLIPGCCC